MTIRMKRTRAAARRLGLGCALGAASLALAGCDLDVANPNAPTDQQVLNTAAGLKAVAVGMQGRLGNALDEAVYVSGLVSGELGATQQSVSSVREFQDFPDQSANSKIEDTNGLLRNLWTEHYEIVKSANDILENVDRVQLAAGTRSGLVALAKLHKAMAFGTLIESFQQIPLPAAGEEEPAFANRAAALSAALDLLASAKADLAAQPVSDEFKTAILAKGFDLEATITAMQARYSLAAGNHEQALGFAGAVPAAASSVISYTAQDPNPLHQIFFRVSYVRANGMFRVNAEAGDKRVDRFTTSEVIQGFGGATLSGLNVYRSESDPAPVFTQDEMTLIRAEAHARQNRLPQAIAELNAVRAAAGLPARTAADLPNQNFVLADIFRQRTYSLYLTGLHWADMRRFDHVAGAKVAWLPYPFDERSNNPNTPANP